ncbi:MAG: hypothetical protein K6F07_00360 [Bacilli bacterium]|nr:hypothetical protein [Bacilli bacterium]
MKNKRVLIGLLFPLAVSCSSNNVIKYVPFTSYVPAADLNLDEDTTMYYRHSEVSPIHTFNGDFKDFKQFLLNSLDNRKHVHMNAKGEDKMLVVPIAFTDSDASTLANHHIYIENAFFGDTSVNKSESVTSFYNKSSYGNLKITGEVAPWYQLDIASSEWKKKGSSNTDASRKITLEAVNYLIDKKMINPSDYDANQDGYIDSVYAIYDHPYSSSGSDSEFFWAYTDFMEKGSQETPSINAYCWSSSYFCINDSKKSDASTYIHETGHLLGLEDYYNTGRRSTGHHFQPTGFFDLMDSNQGDHTVFSKYLFNWSSPKVYKKGASGRVTLRDFSSSGDYFLIPLDSNYSNNPFGEYLLLEYFTPTGLNTPNGVRYQEVDIYGNTITFEFPNIYGLKVYHVDARLAYYEKRTIPTKTRICYVDDPNAETLTKGKQLLVDYATDNSLVDSDVDKINALYHLLEKSGNNTFKEGKLASEDTLFKYGDTFGINTFTELANRAGCTFKISGIGTKAITIDFSAK